MTKVGRTRAAPSSRSFRSRYVRVFARWMCLIFGLSLGVAMASPMILGTSFELVCSSTGPAHVLVKVDGDVHEMGDGQMDCPLCLPGGAPPPAVPMLQPAAMTQPLGRIMAAIPAARLAAMVSAPLPPRGPPLHA
jgi:hypothetical protein